MKDYIYETHAISDPFLPFIFHHCHTKNQCRGLTNWHENIEILRCIEGEGYVQCGAEQFPFKNGEVFIINADVPHSICSDSFIAYRCLIIDNSFSLANGISLSALSFKNRICDPDALALFDEVTASYQNYHSQSPLAVGQIRSAVLNLLLYLCREHYAPKFKVDSPADGRVKEAMAYIRTHIAENFSLEELSRHVGISKFHLCREFKTFTGSTIIQATNLIRCTTAKQLIESGMSVGEAATRCGFENLSYFTKTFKKHLGQSPSAFAPKQV